MQSLNRVRVEGVAKEKIKKLSEVGVHCFFVLLSCCLVVLLSSFLPFFFSCK